jgi:hypothetical protein
MDIRRQPGEVADLWSQLAYRAKLLILLLAVESALITRQKIGSWWFREAAFSLQFNCRENGY